MAHSIIVSIRRFSAASRSFAERAFLLSRSRVTWSTSGVFSEFLEDFPSVRRALAIAALEEARMRLAATLKSNFL